MKRLFWIVVLTGALAGTIFLLRPRPVSVEVGTPEQRSVSEYIAEEAWTRLAEEYVIDLPVSGTLERIQLEIGDEVTKGEEVARLDSYEIEQEIGGIQARMRQAAAQIDGLETAKPKTQDLETATLRIKEMMDGYRIAQRENSIAAIDFEDAKRAHERAAYLRAEGVASQAQLDEAERRYKGLEENLERTRLAEEASKKSLEIAQLASDRVIDSVDDNEYMRDVYNAEIAALQARLNVLESNLEKSKILAPVSGPVLEKYVSDRRVMPAGSPLIKVGDLSTMEIECDVLSEEVGRIQPGDRVVISGKAVGGQDTEGTVKRVYPAAFRKISSLGIEQQRVKVLIEFDNSGLNLRAGTRLDVKIITAEHERVLAVPERATFKREGGWYVFTVEGGVARLTPIGIGLKNDTWAEITEGLSAGVQIVLNPKNDIDDGVRVSPEN